VPARVSQGGLARVTLHAASPGPARAGQGSASARYLERVAIWYPPLNTGYTLAAGRTLAAPLAPGRGLAG
jgi:hypothetical protein